MSNLQPIVLCDLDGVIWLSHHPIAGAVQAIAALRGAGHRVMFVTNNSSPTIADHEAALAAIGISAAGDVVHAAMAAASLVQPGQRVMVCGDPGLVEAIEQRRAVVTTEPPFDFVVVGFHRSFDYEGLARAAAAVRAGAVLIGANDDSTYPTPGGLIPGGGAILAAVRTACGAVPIVAGKPYQPMADLLRNLIGDEAAGSAIMIGDRPETDGLFAKRLGCRYVQVWSGVTGPGETIEPAPDLVADDLAAVADHLLKEMR